MRSCFFVCPNLRVDLFILNVRNALPLLLCCIALLIFLGIELAHSKQDQPSASPDSQSLPTEPILETETQAQQDDLSAEGLHHAECPSRPYQCAMGNPQQAAVIFKMLQPLGWVPPDEWPISRLAVFLSNVITSWETQSDQC